MATRKRNEFLEMGDSDNESLDHGYDSETDNFQKGGRSSKRQKVESGDESAASDVEGYTKVSKLKDEKKEKARKLADSKNEDMLNDDDEYDIDNVIAPELQKFLPNSIKSLSKKNLIATEAAIKKSGVVYLSRIPPFMKPQKLRSLLEPHGSINRIFLTPEDPTSHSKRVRNGGNKKRSFVDGWVEFTNKKDAKKACELLNAQIIGGKKGTYYHDDVWNLLYLKGFKWHNLTEQIAAEDAERASRMRAEISKTTRENKEFVQNVERSKKMEGMKAKEAAKKRKNTESNTPGGDRSATADPQDGGKKEKKSRPERSMTFKQTTVVPKKAAGEQSAQVKRVLSKIF